MIFQQVLSSRLGPPITTSHPFKELACYSETPSAPGQVEHGTIELHPENNTSAKCDVLVGADGIETNTGRSLLREVSNVIAKTNNKASNQLSSKVDPVWSGGPVYRAVIPSKSPNGLGLGTAQCGSTSL